MTHALQILHLAMRLCSWPMGPSEPEACGAHAYLATGAGLRAGLDPRLILAIASVESNFEAGAVSRTRRHCGVLQAMGRGARCQRLRELRTGYVAGGEELRQWRRTCRGKIDCVLAGHGAGNAWVAACGNYPRCVNYRRKVRRRLAALRK